MMEPRKMPKKLNETKSSDTCSWCCIDFTNKTIRKEHTGICQMCHQDIECNRRKSNLFEAISKLKDHKKTCFVCDEIFLDKKVQNHKRSCN